MTDTDQLLFYEDLVRKLRARGVICAITSGLACVHYGVAETTQDCDLLCHPGSFPVLLDLLAETKIDGQPCHYRGNISPPLDARWHHGGWISHFQWDTQPNVTTLDVFGHALRESSPWPQDIFGLYAGAHTVAAMKRTNRDKDWAFVTALGVRMIEADDERGWLHIFEADTLLEMLEEHRCPRDLAASRPALALALKNDTQLAGALNAERKLWEELDRRRIHILQHHLRAYVSAVRRARAGKALPLKPEHAVRVECAGLHLPENPLKTYGLQKYFAEAKAALVESSLVPENALTWLPDVMIYFEWLNT
ncbi:MAG: hypothetical protein FJ398_05775 [Verrucomicrobia bacterium]|nr:hypothetical protein [Verrucomicrobiota bacterium]